MKLTKNFTSEEFEKSSVAKANKIDNTVPYIYRENIAKLAEILQIIRDYWKEPIIINSGYRCKELNRKVGGASNSDHVFGCAVDITAKEKYKNKDLFNLILYLVKDGRISLRQIIDEKKLSWIHISINSEFNAYKNNQILYL